MKYKDITKIKKIQTWIIFVLIILNIIFFIINSNERYIRLDMTKENRFSLSKSTYELLKKLDNHLVIEYYYSDKCKENPTLFQIVSYVKDILIEYESARKKFINVIIEELNYEKDIEKIDELEKDGINFFPLTEVKLGESNQAFAFSGMYIKYQGRQKIFPIIYSDVGFEYMINREIEKMLGITSGGTGIYLVKSDKKLENDYITLKKILNYEMENVLFLNSGSNIPDNISNIIIIGGEALTNYDIFQIDQFLMKGGNAFIALNGVSVVPVSGHVKGFPVDNKLFHLLEHYGFIVKRNIIGDNESFRTIYFESQVFRYPVWPDIREQNFHKDHFVVKGFKHLQLYWPSSILVDKNISDYTEVLFHTSERSFELHSIFDLDIYEFKITYFNYQVQEDEQSYDLAVSFEGKLESFFKNKQIPTNENETEKYTGEKINSGKCKMILIGNDIVFEDKFIDKEKLSLVLLVNSIDWLSKNKDMIEIRNKKRFVMPLDKIPLSEETIDKIEGFKSFIIYFSTFIIPALFIVLAAILYILRKIKNSKLKSKYNESNKPNS
ncbi:MAG: GldG family protein [Spirochaetes bacterium]|nr:GldG family protein [Spirochaetota bacterium]